MNSVHLIRVAFERRRRMSMLVHKKLTESIIGAAIEKITPLHEAQLLTYLKLSGKKVGLLINFNAPVLKDGIVRRVN